MRHLLIIYQDDMAYINEECYDMLIVLGKYQGQHYPAARRYAELYPNLQRYPSAAVILQVIQRLYETGSVLPNKHDVGRDRFAKKLRNTEEII